MMFQREGRDVGEGGSGEMEVWGVGGESLI